MSQPDFKRLLLLAKLSSLVYSIKVEDLAGGVEALELEFVGVIEAPGFQALVCTEPDNSQIVVFRGTPVTCGRDVIDAVVALGYDACLDHTDVGAGAKVLTAPFNAVRAKMDVLRGLLDLNKPITFTGHSLGAVMALLAPALLPRTVNTSVSCFAPFQAANGRFWLSLYGDRRIPTVVGRADDFALGFNHLDSVTRHPCSILHLVGGSWAWQPSWPFCDQSISDHDVDDYVADLAALAGASVGV